MLYRPKRHLTLASFVPREGNQHARAAGIQFIGAEQAQPATLIVAGRPGSGKTHLLHALANFAKQNVAIHSISCMTALQFAEEVMRASLCGDLADVLRFYANEGLVAIDDIERLFYQPEVASALLQLLQVRQVEKRRTLLSATMSLATPASHPLNDFLDHQPAVRLI